MCFTMSVWIIFMFCDLYCYTDCHIYIAYYIMSHCANYTLLTLPFVNCLRLDLFDFYEILTLPFTECLGFDIIYFFKPFMPDCVSFVFHLLHRQVVTSCKASTNLYATASEFLDRNIPFNRRNFILIAASLNIIIYITFLITLTVIVIRSTCCIYVQISES